MEVIGDPRHASCTTKGQESRRGSPQPHRGCWSLFGNRQTTTERGPETLKRMPDFFRITIAAQPRETFLAHFSPLQIPIGRAITPNNAPCDDGPITWPKPTGRCAQSADHFGNRNSLGKEITTGIRNEELQPGDPGYCSPAARLLRGRSRAGARNSLIAFVGTYDIPEFSKVLRATGQVRIRMIASMGISSIRRLIPHRPKGEAAKPRRKFSVAISHS